jgi:hypothetical protein
MREMYVGCMQEKRWGTTQEEGGYYLSTYLTTKVMAGDCGTDLPAFLPNYTNDKGREYNMVLPLFCSFTLLTAFQLLAQY